MFAKSIRACLTPLRQQPAVLSAIISRQIPSSYQHIQVQSVRTDSRIYKYSNDKFSDRDTEPLVPGVTRNEAIPKTSQFNIIRVVYTDKEGAGKWKLLNREDAIIFARSMDTDLVLTSATSKPPVCKCENPLELKKKMQENVAIKKKKSKPKGIKEMFFSAGIDLHDLNTKVKKIITFLGKGHPVKVGIIAKRQTRNSGYNKSMSNTDLFLEETTLKFLEGVENVPGIVIRQEKSNLQEVDLENGINPVVVGRKDFILVQKKMSRVQKNVASAAKAGGDGVAASIMAGNLDNEDDSDGDVDDEDDEDDDEEDDDEDEEEDDDEESEDDILNKDDDDDDEDDEKHREPIKRR